MKKFVSLSGKPMINIDQIHYITKQERYTETTDGVRRYTFSIKFTFADNRTTAWDYLAEGSIAALKAEDDRDHDYGILESALNILYK